MPDFSGQSQVVAVAKRHMQNGKDAPIGIFDSGIGGLTVLSAIRRHLPCEHLIYLGDTARVPYGTKSAETVVRYSSECAEFLMEKGAKAIVVACNTASAFALSAISSKFDLPVIGVIAPGAAAAAAISRKKVVGVIGTTGTIASNAYGRELKSIDSNIRVVSRACPLFVSLVEEGWLDNEVAEAAARIYLDGMRGEGIDALVLGCTHYPLLKGVIGRYLGDSVVLVDSAETTATFLSDTLEAAELKSDRPAGNYKIYVTDLPGRFERIAGAFLGEEPPSVTRVDL